MLLIIILSVFLISVANADTLTLRPPQSVGVKGKLTCNGEPAANILIKLYDKDSKLWCHAFPDHATCDAV